MEWIMEWIKGDDHKELTLCRDRNDIVSVLINHQGLAMNILVLWADLKKAVEELEKEVPHAK